MFFRKSERSKSEKVASVESFVDVMTELDKMSRWGKDRRVANEKLTSRQATSLGVASARNAVYCYLSLVVGSVASVVAWRVGGIWAGLYVGLVGYLPAFVILVWMSRKFFESEGAVWARGAKTVCWGVLNGGIGFFLVSVLMLTLIVLLRKVVQGIVSEFVLFIRQEFGDLGPGAFSSFLTYLNYIWQVIVGDSVLICALLLTVTCLFVSVLWACFFWVSFTEKMRIRKVERLFF